MENLQTKASVDTEPEYKAPHWFSLDNAATIYPAVRTRVYACTYRICFIMKDDVDPIVLQQAVDDIAPRFPSFFVQLRTGLFWHYLERTNDTKIVVEESEYPCHRISLIDTDKPAFRIIYYKRRLGIEMFHSVTDGGACITMLKTLVAHYLELKGFTIPNNGEFIDITEAAKAYECEDDFQKVYNKNAPSPDKEEKSFQYKIKTIPNYFQVVHGIMPVNDIKAQCKPMGLSITDYLAAALMYSVYTVCPENKKPIRVSIPISLRPLFGYETLRNFSSFTNIGFVPKKDGSTTFEDVVEAIRGKIRSNVTAEAQEIPVSRNVKGGRIPIVRFLPNCVKRPVLKAAYIFVGQQKFLCSMTNLGICKMPAEMYEQIDRMEVLLGGSPNETIACAITCIDDKLNFSFTGSSKNFDMPRAFFRFLSAHDIRVRIESSNKEACR